MRRLSHGLADMSLGKWKICSRSNGIRMFFVVPLNMGFVCILRLNLVTKL